MQIPVKFQLPVNPLAPMVNLLIVGNLPIGAK